MTRNGLWPALSQRVRGALPFAVAAVAVAAAAVTLPGSGMALAGDVGYQGMHFSGTGSAPTGAKNESKLWWNDGIWWAVMWSETRSDNVIYRLDPSSHAWEDTGVIVDTRSGTRPDVLWDGSKLYIASHGFTNTPTSNFPARLFRYSYNAAAKTYSLDASFPVAINNFKTETLVIAKDSTGRLWATWNQGTSIYVNSTTGDDATWGTPFELPASGANSVNVDDISSIVAFGGDKIGVMWSNQNTMTMNFTIHADGESRTSWQTTEIALSGPNSADDHVNLKADADGRVYAAVKTSQTVSTAPLVLLLVRQPSGGWIGHTFGTQSDHHTRPIVVLDETNRAIHMFATAGEAGGIVYHKTTSMDEISFAPGAGTPFMKDESSADLNDATSAKRNVNATSGLVVMGSNETTSHYWHNELSLGGVGLTANFTGAPTSGTAPLAVTFTDTSTGETPTAWSWNFGDGTTSTAQHPVHVFQVAGSYDITLTVTGADGQRSTRTRLGYVNVAAQPVPPTSDFTAEATAGAAPLAVAFTDTSSGSPTSWSWGFGDGATSSAQNPSHTYAAAGTYTVSLTATNAHGSDVETKVGFVNVSPPPPTLRFVPAADAYVSTLKKDVNYGSDPDLRVKNGGTGPTAKHYRSYLKFDVLGVAGSISSAKLRLFVLDPGTNGGAVFRSGNGWTESGITWNAAPTVQGSALANVGSTTVGTWVEVNLPAEEFAGGDGTYSLAIVSQSVHDGTTFYGSGEGANPPELVVEVSAAPSPPVAGFAAAPTSGVAPLGVSFNDLSADDPTSWSWNFGDGSTSSDRNPVHTYTQPGTYSVSLTASNSGGSDTFTRVDYVTVSVPPPPTANFTGTPTSGEAPLAVSFGDASTGGTPTSWSWSFGDGSTSSERSPVHTYTQPGTYTVSLTAANAGGSDTFTRLDYVTVSVPAPPTANFTGTPTSGEAPLAVSFGDASTGGTPTSWSWSFGDGSTSSNQNPVHTYTQPGTYTVSLTATNAGGGDTVTKVDYVTVAAPPPIVTLTPVADSYTSKTAANTNFGAGTELHVKNGGTAATGPHYHTFISFDLSGVTGTVSGAKLRLYVTDDAANGGTVFATSPSWSESAITWNNEPTANGSALAIVGSVAIGNWVEITIPVGPFTGAGTHSFVITSTTPTDGHAAYASRETATAPQLVLTVQ